MSALESLLFLLSLFGVDYAARVFHAVQLDNHVSRARVKGVSEMLPFAPRNDGSIELIECGLWQPELDDLQHRQSFLE